MIESLTAQFDPPLDLVHLARQCLGDHELEAELLQLFRQQAPTLTARLSGSPHLSLDAKAKIAQLASAGGDQSSAEPGAIAALLSAVHQAVAEIDRLRG
jgi:hypothetical protein